MKIWRTYQINISLNLISGKRLQISTKESLCNVYKAKGCDKLETEIKNTDLKHLVVDMKNELQMKDVPKIVIALDWFESGDIYNLSKHVKSLFLSSHRARRDTLPVPSFNLNVPQNPSQSEHLNVPQNPFKSSSPISPS